MTADRNILLIEASQNSFIAGSVCLADLVAERAARTPDAVLILSPGRSGGLSCAQLLKQSEGIARALNDWGLGRGDRVATCLAGGPEAAALLVGITFGLTYAPINPRAARPEVERTLRELGVRAIVLSKGMESAGRAAAINCDVPIIEMACDPDAPAGTLSLSCQRPPGPASRASCDGFAGADDIFYVLQTSGTTARPKTAPLSHRRFLAAVTENARVLQTGPADRGLHVLSMSHVMGITSVIYSLMSGAEMVYAPAFDAARFFPMVRDVLPTWFTAPPAIHQTLIAHAPDHLEFLKSHSPRFVRSGASPLPVALLNEIERIWNAPMVEAYGMSECPVISSNHAPPGPRKPGSIGLPCGVEVVLLDDSGRLLPRNTERVGEIAVRGPQVMDEYERNPDANAAAFIDGWFRTGDLGHFDDDGFLYYTGRRKEMINRAGMKIAPLEVDQVILSHPSIADALAFSMPDARLGEDVGVAAVLRPGAATTELELRRFAAEHLSEHKVPRRVVFVDQIPAGVTGKPQRIGLAAKLGMHEQPGPCKRAPFVAPRSVIEEALAAIWTQVLGERDAVGINDSFLELGGDSLQATAMFLEVERLLGRRLPVASLVAAPTIAILAEAMSQEADVMPKTCLVPIQPRGSRRPLFCLPGMHGHVFNFYPLARRLGEAQPVYGLQLPLVYQQPDLPAQSVEEIAQFFIAEIRAIQPQGPYRIAGYSFGGYVGYEMGQQLRREEQIVELLAMFDTCGPGYPRRRGLLGRALHHVRMISRSRTRSHYLADRFGAIRDRFPRANFANSKGAEEAARHPEHPSIQAIRAYRPMPYPGRLTLFMAVDQPAWLGACEPDETMGWGRLAADIDVHRVAGNHLSMLDSAHAGPLAEAVRSCL